MEYIKIAEDRIGAVIGKNGKVKSEIERALSVEINVESEEGSVTVKNVGNDPLGEWKARDVIKAISYGIEPNSALKLKSDNQTLVVVNITDIIGRSKKALTRQKARIIGRQGKTRNHISGLTDTSIALKGKHVAIVGEMENVMIARDAVEALAEGLPHGVVYKFLEKKCTEMRKNRNIEMWQKR